MIAILKNTGILIDAYQETRTWKTETPVKLKKSKPVNKSLRFYDNIPPTGYLPILYFHSTAVATAIGDTDHPIVMFFHYCELYVLSETYLFIWSGK